jgi:hypothetical protein
MNLRNSAPRLTRDRGGWTSAAVVAASLLASVAWLLLHDRSEANRLGTAIVVALPLGGLIHAFWKSVGWVAIVANAFALLVALYVALLNTMSWPGPAV